MMAAKKSQKAIQAERNERKTLLLYRPNEECKAEWIDYCSHYAESLLRPKFDRLLAFLQTYEKVQVVDDDGNRVTYPGLGNLYRPQKGWKKTDRLAVLALFLLDARNFYSYFDTLPANQQEIWRKLAANYYMRERNVEKLLGKPCMPFANYFYRERTAVDELKWFGFACYDGPTLERGEREKEFYFYLSPFLGITLYKLLNPLDEKTVRADRELPKEEVGMVFAGEEEILCRMPLLLGLYKNKKLDVGYMRQGVHVLERIKSLLKLEEFYPGSEGMEGQMRLRFVLDLFATYYPKTAGGSSSAKQIRALLDEAFSRPTDIFQTLFFHLRGLDKKMLIGSNLRLFSETLWNCLHDFPVDSWISLEEICQRVHLKEDYRYLGILFEPNQLEKQPLFNTWNGEWICMDTLYQAMGVPFLQAMLFALAAFGVLDVAYRPLQEKACSPFSGLHHVRLTELGAYVVGYTKRYQLKDSKGMLKQFEVSDSCLIVQAYGDDNPFETFLQEIADPIGGRRYRVTYGSFLNPCRNRQSLMDLVDLFRQYFCEDLPTNWQEFFDDLQKRMNPFKLEPVDKYLVYKVPHDDRKLQMLLSTDPELRRYALKAENYLLLIEEKNLVKFENRLKIFGYLL